jgi:basic membrane protein A
MLSMKKTFLTIVMSGLLSSVALAADIKSIAILTPEQGSDFGWNQQGVEAAKAAGRATGVEVVPAENLGYGDVRDTLRELAEDGAGLMIAHAGGYSTAASEIAAETGVPVATTDRPDLMKPGLVADYTLSGYQAAYLAGRLAAKMSRSGSIGIVAAAEPPTFNSQTTGFAEGAKAEKPGIVLRYAVIGPAGFSDAAGGKRLTESLIGAGADIIFGQGDGASFGMLQAVETTKAADGGKVYFIDIIGDKTSIDKGFLLSSVAWNLTPIFTSMIEDVKAGKFGSTNYQISLKDNSAFLLKTKQIPDVVWAEVMAIRDEIVSGEIKLEPKFDIDSVHKLVSQLQ